jgi:hypothetical protein
MKRPVKRTKEEIAQSIIKEGILDGYYSSVYTRYYDAFGQRWKLTYSTLGNIKSIEQVRQDGTPIRF